MFNESADLYDLIYSSLKDYRQEVAFISKLISGLNPETRSILDVACGTGEHARLLAGENQYLVDGIDVNPDFVRIAASKVPGGRFLQADMICFELDRRYDVVMCLFSSIGYVCTLENVIRTLRCFRDHLNGGGMVLVEPWFTPDAWNPGRVYMNTVDTDHLKVCRMSRSEVEERLSRVNFEYLIGLPDRIEHRTEVHELGLFTVDEMKSCFKQAEMEVEYDPDGLTGRGLYIGYWSAAEHTKHTQAARSDF